MVGGDVRDRDLPLLGLPAMSALARFLEGSSVELMAKARVLRRFSFMVLDHTGLSRKRVGVRWTGRYDAAAGAVVNGAPNRRDTRKRVWGP